MKRHLPRIAGTLAVLAVLGYAVWEARALIEGPIITIETPQDGAVTDESLMRIAGVAKHAKDLRLDGRPIFIDTEGRFDERLLLLYGYNIIELVARDVRGKTATTTLHVVYR